MDRAKYWERLKPVVYKNAAEAANIPFKQFMRTHIRYYIPGIFRKLIIDSDAVKKWGDLNYLMENLHDTQVEGTHYVAEKEMKFYATMHPFQRGRW